MTPRARDAGRAQQIALADQALGCAEAIARQGRRGVQEGASPHVADLRLVAHRSDALGLSTLGEAARLMEAVLIVPRPSEALLQQAVDVLVLAGRDARRESRDVRADLGPVVDALRAHVRHCEGT
jgi:hypothetical protein